MSGSLSVTEEGCTNDSESCRHGAHKAILPENDHRPDLNYRYARHRHRMYLTPEPKIGYLSPKCLEAIMAEGSDPYGGIVSDGE